MQKSCQRCGTEIQCDDWYAFIRTKYCRRCAKDVRRQQQAEYARELRRKTREQNMLTRQLCTEQQAELERLRELLLVQRERVRTLENEISEAKGSSL